jgi:hypothetical protein
VVSDFPNPGRGFGVESVLMSRQRGFFIFQSRMLVDSEFLTVDHRAGEGQKVSGKSKSNLCKPLFLYKLRRCSIHSDHVRCLCAKVWEKNFRHNDFDVICHNDFYVIK